MNYASPNLAIWFQRSRANQPDPTFPRSPGIILETFSFNLSTATARLVHSMNCEHHNLNFISYNDLICTACSPKRACEQPVKNSKQPSNQSDLHFTNANYSQLFQAKNGCGEQVPIVKLWKNFVRQENFEAQSFEVIDFYYFPMQNWLKIESSKSSVAVLPTISPTALTAIRKSSATSSSVASARNASSVCNVAARARPSAS